MKLRIGVVGLGSAWQARHRPALRALADRFEVRAICEEVALLADQAAQEFDATAVDGFRALTAREDIDAVLLLSSQWYGALPILAACQLGKAIYCATNAQIMPAQASEIKSCVEASGIAFMSEFPRRHAPATLRLKELIATRLGQPQLLFCHLRSTRKPTSDGEERQEEIDHELLELVDWCRYIVGQEAISVIGIRHGSLNTHPSEHQCDYQMMSIEFDQPHDACRPAMAQISVGDYIPNDWTEAIAFRAPAAMQIHCENGIAFVDLPSTLIWFDEAGRHLESLDSERPIGEHLLCQFHRSVTSLVQNTSSLEDTFRALSIVTATQSSYREGRRIILDFN